MLCMNFVAHDLEWTESMKQMVRRKIVSPLVHRISDNKLELDVHLGREATRYVMWAEMQSAGGRKRRSPRCRGGEFPAVVNELSSQMRSQVRREIQ